MSYRVFVLQTFKKHCLKSLYNAKYADEKNPLNYAFCNAKMHELTEYLNELNTIQLGASPRQQMAYAQQQMQDQQQMAQQANWVQQQRHQDLVERASQSEWVQQQQKLRLAEQQAEWDWVQQQAWNPTAWNPTASTTEQLDFGAAPPPPWRQVWNPGPCITGIV